MDFSSILNSAETELQQLDFKAFFLRIGSAVLVSTLISARPWRLLLGKPLPKTEMVQAQLLLGAASAVITVVIGNSVAKAFGLVGLGGFVRFKSGLKDPRDAAILFLVIGLSMACGHGAMELGLVGTMFASAILFVVDLFDSRSVEPQRVKLSATAENPAAAEPILRQAMGARNVLVKGCVVDFALRRVELELEERLPGSVAAALREVNPEMLKELKYASVSKKVEELV